MKQRAGIAGVALACALVMACGKSGGGSAGDSKRFGQLQALADQLHSGGPWADALATVEKEVGKANVVKGDWYTWAAVDGDACFRLQLGKSEDTLNGVLSGKVSKMLGAKFDECAAAAKTAPAP